MSKKGYNSQFPLPGVDQRSADSDNNLISNLTSILNIPSDQTLNATASRELTFTGATDRVAQARGGIFNKQLLPDLGKAYNQSNITNVEAAQKFCQSKTYSGAQQNLQKDACLTGVGLSNRFFYSPKEPISSIISQKNNFSDDKIKQCGDFLGKTQYCNGFQTVKGMYAGGDLGPLLTRASGYDCNTTIKKDVAGICVCGPNSKNPIGATVDAGHTTFSCNEVCQPGVGNVYNFTRIPPTSDKQALVGVGGSGDIYKWENSKWNMVNIQGGIVKDFAYYLGNFVGLGSGIGASLSTYDKSTTNGTAGGWHKWGASSVGVQSIAVYNNKLYGVSSKGLVVWQFGRGSGGSWNIVSNTPVKSIGVHDNILYGVVPGGKGIVKWSGSTWDPFWSSNSFVVSSVSSFNGYMIVVSNNEVYQGAAGNGLPSKTGSPFKKITGGYVTMARGFTNAEFQNAFGTANEGFQNINMREGMSVQYDHSVGGYIYDKEGAQQYCISKGLRLCGKQQVIDAKNGKFNACNSAWTTDAGRGWWSGTDKGVGCGTPQRWETYADPGGRGGAHCCRATNTPYCKVNIGGSCAAAGQKSQFIEHSNLDTECAAVKEKWKKNCPDSQINARYITHKEGFVTLREGMESKWKQISKPGAHKECNSGSGTGYTPKGAVNNLQECQKICENDTSCKYINYMGGYNPKECDIFTGKCNLAAPGRAYYYGNHESWEINRNVQQNSQSKCNGKKCVLMVGPSNTNTKTIPLPYSYMNVDVQPQNNQYSGNADVADRFSITVIGNKAVVKRIDYNGGWSQNLILNAFMTKDSVKSKAICIDNPQWSLGFLSPSYNWFKCPQIKQHGLCRNKQFLPNPPFSWFGWIWYRPLIDKWFGYPTKNCCECGKKEGFSTVREGFDDAKSKCPTGFQKGPVPGLLPNLELGQSVCCKGNWNPITSSNNSKKWDCLGTISDPTKIKGKMCVTGEKSWVGSLLGKFDGKSIEVPQCAPPKPKFGVGTDPNKPANIVSGTELVKQCNLGKINQDPNQPNPNLEEKYKILQNKTDNLNQQAGTMGSQIQNILDTRHKSSVSTLNARSKTDQLIAHYQKLYSCDPINPGCNPSKDSWGALQNKNSDTLTGMEEEGLLYNSSQKMKYYTWLGLAIIALVIVIRKLKS